MGAALDEAVAQKTTKGAPWRSSTGSAASSRIAIAVVERERGERRAFSILDAPARLVERDELEALPHDDAKREIEKFRRDLQEAIRRVAWRDLAPRAHAMKRQDDAAPARRGARQAMQPARAKSCKAGADESVPYGHDRPRA